MTFLNNLFGYRYTRVSLVLLTLITSLVIPALSYATEASQGGGEHGSNIAVIFLWIAIILILAKVSALVERVGQPAVLGEILMGICLGNLPLLGIYFFAPMVSNEIMHFLAELGVVILLFYIGMESSVEGMAKVGIQSFLVAVIDDVMGLVILAVVSAIVFKGGVSMAEMGIILAKAIIFLVGAVLIGTPLAPFLGKFFSKIHTGGGMKFALVISFGLVIAYLASLDGLAPIVGAFVR